jgi:phage baseplate assembly protein W
MALRRVTPGLKDNTLVTGKKIEYSDIDLTFTAKSGSPTSYVNGTGTDFKGDVFKKTDAAAVIQSVQNILLTNRLEKPFKPKYGANLRAMLFETVETYSETIISQMVTNALARDEPRVTVTDVKFFDGDDLVRKGAGSIFSRNSLRNTVAVIVEFTIENEQGEFTARVNMNRLR